MSKKAGRPREKEAEKDSQGPRPTVGLLPNTKRKNSLSLGGVAIKRVPNDNTSASA